MGIWHCGSLSMSVATSLTVLPLRAVPGQAVMGSLLCVMSLMGPLLCVLSLARR